ncbi:MAG: SLC26A/SulP transporter family protein [Burkholderiales bacterium]|nr:SLC26A/SulP transporter family protein [Burkholderiales bacterium]
MLSWLRHEFAGGAASAALALPLCIGFGLYAFAPLGPAYAHYGVLAGLYSALIPPLIAYLLGARSISVFGPRNTSLVVVQSLFANMLAAQLLASGGGANAVLAYMACVVFASGCFQAAIATLSLGSLMKYIPHPVTAGFQNGAALLLLVAQIESLLGLDAYNWFETRGAVQPLTMLVGATSIAVMLGAHRFTRRLPSLIVGLVSGVALYHLLAALGYDQGLGPYIGEFRLVWPESLPLLGAADLFYQIPPLRLALGILGWSITLAIVSTLDIMMVQKVVENVTRTREDHDRALMRIGVANMAGALVGALPCSVSMVNTLASHTAGGRTWKSGVVSMALVLVSAALVPTTLALIPTVAVAALLAVTAYRLFDRWTLVLFMRVLRPHHGERRAYLLDLLIVVMVTGTMLAGQIVLAVILGVALSTITFAWRMSRSIVRHAYRGDVARSRKTRDLMQNALLSAHANGIAVFELDGALFFGTAEKLVLQIESMIEDGPDCVILDMRRIHDMDSTGARLLIQLNETLAASHCSLAIAGAMPGSRIEAYTRESGLAAALTRSRVFKDLDHAIEWAEEQIIAKHGEDEQAGSFPLGKFSLLAGMDREQVEIVASHLAPVRFAAGTVVFEEGSEGLAAYLIISGVASVTLHQLDQLRPIRLVTFSPGTVFGEMALLDGEPRSATVVADTELECQVLSIAEFERLKAAHPHIAIRLLSNLARESSLRLRRANRLIFELEH